MAAAAEDGLWTPAAYLGDIRIPGQGDQIRKPTTLYYDTVADEIIVGDSGNNRLLIFSGSGAYKFTIPANDYLSGIQDVACHPEGFIYVLGRDAAGWLLFGFDFDGQPLGRVELPRTWQGTPLHLSSVESSESGTLVGLDAVNHRLFTFTIAGEILETVPMSELHGERLESDDGLGHLALRGTTALIPVPTRGSVLKYDMVQGQWSSVGYFGSTPGSLNFPVAATLSATGQILVLDQARFVVVCYGADGRVLGEFGGKGYRSGWFYRPSLLAVAADDRVLVGQLYENRIQICAAPDYIRIPQVPEAPAADETHGSLRPSGLLNDGSSPRRSPTHNTVTSCNQGTEPGILARLDSKGSRSNPSDPDRSQPDRSHLEQSHLEVLR